MRSRFLLLVLLLPVWASAQTREVKVMGVPDTLAIGRPFELELRVTHATSDSLQLPVSSRDWRPWEVVTYSPPERTGQQTRVRLVVVSFSVDSLQEVRPKVDVYTAPGRQITLTAPAASAKLNSRLPPNVSQLDSLSFRADARLASLSPPFPWVQVGSIVLLVVGALALLAVLLREPLRRTLQAWRFRRGVLWQLDALEHHWQHPLSPDAVRSANHTWKRLLSTLTHRAWEGLTAQEAANSSTWQATPVSEASQALLAALLRLEESAWFSSHNQELPSTWPNLPTGFQPEFQRWAAEQAPYPWQSPPAPAPKWAAPAS